MRVIFIPFLLLCVLSIGIPWDNPLGIFSDRVLIKAGLDVGMTPLTIDMSMMSGEEDRPLYEKELTLTLLESDGKHLDVNPYRLHLYRHKIPMILFFEAVSRGGVATEISAFLCRSFEDFSKNSITGFRLSTKSGKHLQGFDEFQNCF